MRLKSVFFYMLYNGIWFRFSLTVLKKNRIGSILYWNMYPKKRGHQFYYVTHRYMYIIELKHSTRNTLVTIPTFYHKRWWKNILQLKRKTRCGWYTAAYSSMCSLFTKVICWQTVARLIKTPLCFYATTSVHGLDWVCLANESIAIGGMQQYLLV